MRCKGGVSVTLFVILRNEVTKNPQIKCKMCSSSVIASLLAGVAIPQEKECKMMFVGADDHIGPLSVYHNVKLKMGRSI